MAFLRRASDGLLLTPLCGSMVVSVLAEKLAPDGKGINCLAAGGGSSFVCSAAKLAADGHASPPGFACGGRHELLPTRVSCDSLSRRRTGRMPKERNWETPEKAAWVGVRVSPDLES
jgi:hypothetical protein